MLWHTSVMPVLQRLTQEKREFWTMTAIKLTDDQWPWRLGAGEGEVGIMIRRALEAASVDLCIG